MLPRLWRAEYLNVLYLAVKTRGLDRGSALRAWRAGRELVGENEAEVSETSVLETAIHYSITAYDAQFVVLAEDLGIPLVTADRGLVKACPDVAVTYGGFLGGRS
jgi:predicted nucleic acid-binding protein